MNYLHEPCGNFPINVDPEQLIFFSTRGMSRSLDSLNIPDKTKHYVKMILNPLLEDLVTKLIRDQPENPAQYMYDLLGQVSGVHAALEREVARLKVR